MLYRFIVIAVDFSSLLMYNYFHKGLVSSKVESVGTGKMSFATFATIFIETYIVLMGVRGLMSSK